MIALEKDDSHSLDTVSHRWIYLFRRSYVNCCCLYS